MSDGKGAASRSQRSADLEHTSSVSAVPDMPCVAVGIFVGFREADPPHALHLNKSRVEQSARSREALKSSAVSDHGVWMEVTERDVVVCLQVRARRTHTHSCGHVWLDGCGSKQLSKEREGVWNTTSVGALGPYFHGD